MFVYDEGWCDKNEGRLRVHRLWAAHLCIPFRCSTRPVCFSHESEVSYFTLSQASTHKAR